MERTDVHVHMTGTSAKPEEYLAAMDKAGVARTVVISPYPGIDAVGQIAHARFLSQFCSKAPERLLGFVWLEPRLPSAPTLLAQAADMPGIVGCKMIPHHWYPYDEQIFPVYAKAQELDLPFLFHSGILWGFDDSSRFCRPVYYEVLQHFPKVRFALAHISWPWTDECIATAGSFRAAVRNRQEDMQMWIDMTPGTPRFYRTDAVDKAYKYLGAARLLWGTDCRVEGYNPRDTIEMDDEILGGELSIPADEQQMICHANADAWIGSRLPT